jgi:hypothetical protein
MAYAINSKVRYSQGGQNYVGIIKGVLDNGNYRILPDGASSGDTVLIGPNNILGLA